MKFHKAQVAAAVFGLLAVAAAMAQPVQRGVVDNLLARASAADTGATTGRGRATLPTCATGANSQGFGEGDVVLLNHRAGTNGPGLYVCRGGAWTATAPQAPHNIGYGQLDTSLQDQIKYSAVASETELGGTSLYLHNNNGDDIDVPLIGLLNPITLRDRLQGLSGEERLDASAIKNLPLATPPKGDLLATSSGLPTTGLSGRLNHTWTLASGISDRYALVGSFFICDGSNGDFTPPNDNQLGYVIEAEVGGVIRGRAFAAWGPSFDDNGDNNADSILVVGGTTKLNVRHRVHNSGASRIHLFAESSTLPNHTVVKIYEWLN